MRWRAGITGIRKTFHVRTVFGVIAPGGSLSENTKSSLVLKLGWLCSQGKVFLCALGLVCCPLFGVFVYLSEMNAVRQTTSSPPDLLLTHYLVMSMRTHILTVLVQPVAFGRSVTIWRHLEQRVRKYAVPTELECGLLVKKREGRKRQRELKRRAED